MDVPKDNSKANECTDSSRLNELRTKVLEYAKEYPNDIHHLDVKLLSDSDLWINRFLNFNNQSIDNSFSHLIETMKYRKETGIRSIDKTVMGAGKFNLRSIFIHIQIFKFKNLLELKLELK